ncbi:hypothetical protein W822_17460 [Advenella kashmirensis W13003]|uniref:Uncharacterized protein n=1 Tax=Advenella kashmirensis W13003 TaxID=1424334 RepID=V8QQX7_9BURK|nr:hypothetical protein W822_17460 [Advenella kashmirensis W13003]
MIRIYIYGAGAVAQQFYRYLPMKSQCVANAPSLSYPFAQPEK